MQTFPTTETKFQLPTPSGELEVQASPTQDNNQSTIAIICHPHPLHGGTMNNKVVSTLARTFRDLNIPSVRFNFRGVGKSTGVFADGVGEKSDLLSIIQWVKKTSPNATLWLAGFSFGGFIAAQVATEVSVAQLVTVAPQVSRFTAIDFPPITVPWILIQGEQDEIVSSEAVFKWIETLNPKPTLIRIPDTGHFFHGKLLELRSLLEAALKKSQTKLEK